MLVTDSQIMEIEHALLNGSIFNTEQRDFIKCFDKSIDLVACPGSGKTTALLAKLILLAHKMPLENNRGICVLTHTNVAIDTIKQKLGNKSDILFSYPNYFGTIQSFVDSFLFIPFWTIYKKMRPIKIGNEDYERAIKKRIYYKNFLHGFDEDTIKNKIHYLIVNERFIYEYRLRYRENDIQVCIPITGKRVDFKPKSKKGWSAEQKKDLEQWFIKYKWKTHILDNVFAFDDAYFFSEIYLCHYQFIIPSVQKRFRYIFIDEMQDTDLHQYEILNKLFPSNAVDPIVQCIGDPNQSIFTNSSKTDNLIWNPDLNNSERTLFLSDSLRFGEAISKRIKYVCATNISDKLHGNPSVTSQIPHLILYNDSTIKENVLNKFIELIVRYRIKPDNKKPFKAIGSVGKENDKITLKSYFTDYCSKSKINKTNFNNVISFLKRPKSEYVKTKGVKIYSDIFYELFLHLLEVGEIKTEENNRAFTKNSLSKHLIKKDENHYKLFLIKIAEWSLCLHNSIDYDETLYQNIKTFLNLDFIPFMGITYKKVQSFIEDIGITDDLKKTAKYNKYACAEYPGIEIEIATIHSVKGETHKATLYLDTFYYKNDSEHIKSQLKGVTYINETTKDIRKKRALKMAHVAMSRPTELLCFACNQNIFTDEEIRLLDYQNDPNKGWIIEYC